MRGAAAALAVLLALDAHAQTPPDTPPVPPAQTPVPSTPPPADADAAQAQAPPDSQPAAETPAPSQPREAAPTPRASAPHATPHAQPTAPAPAAATDQEGELARLRAEVSRLQAELDAERAAAAPPAIEESSAVPAPMRGAWEWCLAAALLGLAAGFVLGWRVLDRRIRRKYGGLRIY